MNVNTPRVDGAGVPLDNRMTQCLPGSGGPVPVLPHLGIQSQATAAAVAVPGSIVNSSPSAGALRVAFAAVAGATQYTVEYRVSGQTPPAGSVHVTSSPANFTGLATGNYQAHIRAETNDGYTLGNWSAWSSDVAVS